MVVPEACGDRLISQGNNMTRAKVVTYRGRGNGGLLRWRVKSGNGEDISKTSEGYYHEADRAKSIRLTFEATQEWLKVNDPGYFMPTQPPMDTL